MDIIHLVEGNSYQLNETELPLFKKYLSQNTQIPARIINNNLVFDDYTIGSITVAKTSIIIDPRITGLTTNDYFEMQLYAEGIVSDSITALLKQTTNYGLQENLVSLFIDCLQKLVKKGLDGSFYQKIEYSNTIHGRIVVDKIDPVHLAQDQLPIEYTLHTLETADNKLIKLALNKCRSLIDSNDLHQQFAQVAAYFENIQVTPQEENTIQQRIKLEHTSHMNTEYDLAIELSLKILKDIKLNMQGSHVLGTSFLVNSNDIFEKYCRAVLHNGLTANVIKWETPHATAKFIIDNVPYIKSYVPDILINYNQAHNTTYALLDAKNKDISDHHKIGHLADLYQVVYYCQSLHTNMGGLVYPTKKEIKPTKILLNNFADINFYAFFVNFALPLKQRNLQLCQEVSEKFLLI